MTTHFLLNDTAVETDTPAGTLLLDFLRVNEGLVGTKEGCREGDCGACTVLVGTRSEGKTSYLSMTSCMIPVGELHGKHVVTVEGLNKETLSPVQQAMVDNGGSQCGFCTPGIVVSLTGMVIEKGNKIQSDDVAKGLSGHLCRCTGYASIKRAGEQFIEQFSGLDEGEDLLESLTEADLLPDWFSEAGAYLDEIPEAEIEDDEVDIFIAGGTDLYVQEPHGIPFARVATLNRYAHLKGIEISDDTVIVGALTTFEEFGDNPEIQTILPEVQNWMQLIASHQIRNRATIGGNIINASPIGDMSNLMMALNATLTLADAENTRTVPIANFYTGYKQFDKTESEILTHISFPKPDENTKINFEKVSKRTYLDIATVNSAFRIQVIDNIVTEAFLSIGGVAAMPKNMPKTAKFLVGKSLSFNLIAEASNFLQDEISPIDDVRGSAAYKRLLARQLFIAHWQILYPALVTEMTV